MGTSPDAINENVVEIKCSTSEKTSVNYIDSEQNTKPKFIYQMQIQMFLTGLKKAIVVVAHHNFETTKQIQIIFYDYDTNLVDMLVKDVNNFWFENICNKVLQRCSQFLFNQIILNIDQPTSNLNYEV